MTSETKAVENRSKCKAALLFFGLALLFWVVSALSRSTENTRIGLETPWDTPWILEGSSLFTMALLFFLVWEIEKRWPISPERPILKLAAHLAGSFVFSALHILAMVFIRKAYWAVFRGAEYIYLRNPIQDILYDYRKDAVTYVTILMIIYLTRNFEFAKAEQKAAQTDASVDKKITLKCGGRTVLLPSADIEAAQADGNYVFVYTQDSKYHTRMTLSECLQLLRAAGQDARQVHRSWVLDFSKIKEIAKTPKGDVEIMLHSGRQVRGSRRYVSTPGE